MIKRVLTFVSGVCFGRFYKSKFCIKSKLSSSKISLQKRTNLYILYIFFEFFHLLLKFYAQFYLILNFSNSCNGKNACAN